MAGPSSGDPRKVVLAALSGNALIALAKFAAAGLSGSVAMLAEAVHSVADTANQALLLVGMGLSVRHDPVRYPFGRARERYFWAFVVSLMLFLLGGLFALYEGVHKLVHAGEHTGSPVVPLVVLVISLALEASSFWVAFSEFNRSRGKRSIADALFRGRDPTIPVVLLEDTGAVVGLSVALVAVLASWATRSAIADGLGSIVIGLLLCAIGVALAYETHGLIIGEAATPEMRERAYAVIRATAGVEEVTQMLTVHLGPDSIVLALKIRFPRGTPVEEVERITDSIEERVRAQVPEMKKIFVEADGDYDASLDPLAARGGVGG